MWFILTTLRSTIVSDSVPGKLSALMSKLMGMFFEPGKDVSNGVSFRFPDGSFRTVFFRLSALIADESALKHTIDMKGASGTKPCMLCQNVVSIHSDLPEHDTSNFLVDLSETDIRKFALYKDADVDAIINKLVVAKDTLGPGAFKRLQQSTGFKLNKDGILCSAQLKPHFKPITAVMFDWMHVYIASGLFNHEAGLFLVELQQHAGISHTMLHDYCQHFQWPSRLKGTTGKLVFQKRSTGASDLKCSAGDALSVYALVRLYIVDEVLPNATARVKDVCGSFLLLCDVLDRLLKVARGTVSHIELHRVIQQHLDAHKSVYGASSFFPKSHMALHLGMQLESHGTLISCFVHERKHKEVKRLGNHLQNTSVSFERTILQEALYSQILTLRDAQKLPNCTVHLVDPKPASATIQNLLAVSLAPEPINDCFASRTVCHAPSQHASIGDCVQFLLEGALKIGQVQFHASVSGRCVSCVSPWSNLGKNRFETSSSVPVLVDSSSLKETHVFAINGTIARVVP